SPSAVLSFWWFTATWSLAVEEQFYLLAPLVVRQFSKRTLSLFLILVAIAAPLVRWFVRDHFASGAQLADRLMPCRADSLAIGMLAAVLWSYAAIRSWLTANVWMLYGAFAAFAAGVAYLWRYHSDPLLQPTQTVGYTWLALFFAVTMLLALS